MNIHIACLQVSKGAQQMSRKTSGSLIYALANLARLTWLFMTGGKFVHLTSGTFCYV